MFAIHQSESKGFHMKFRNGWTLSVQFGYGNYCERRHFMNDQKLNHGALESEDAEIAIFNPEGSMVDVGSDQVVGRVCADHVADVMALVSRRDKHELVLPMNVQEFINGYYHNQNLLWIRG